MHTEESDSQSVTVAKAGIRVTVSFVHAHHSRTFMRYMAQFSHSLLDQVLSNVASINGHSRPVNSKNDPLNHIGESDE